MKTDRSHTLPRIAMVGIFLTCIGIAPIPVLAASSGTFDKTGSMNTARIGHSATLLGNGEVLVAGGWDGSDVSPTFFASAELYDPVRGKWSFTGSMTVARTGQGAVLLHDGRVLVAGGDGKTPSTAELYNRELSASVRDLT